MRKLKQYLDVWLEGKKVKGIYVTPEDIRECEYIYNAISMGQKPEFINSNVKKILDICNIETVEEGIGWRVA